MKEDLCVSAASWEMWILCNLFGDKQMPFYFSLFMEIGLYFTSYWLSLAHSFYIYQALKSWQRRAVQEVAAAASISQFACYCVYFLCLVQTLYVKLNDSFCLSVVYPKCCQILIITIWGCQSVKKNPLSGFILTYTAVLLCTLQQLFQGFWSCPILNWFQTDFCSYQHSK